MKYLVVIGAVAIGAMAILVASATSSDAQKGKGMSEAQCMALASQRGFRPGRPATKRFVRQCQAGKVG